MRTRAQWPAPGQRKFLGYSVSWHKKPKLKIAPSRRQRFAAKILQTLHHACGQSLRQVLDQLNPVPWLGVILPTHAGTRSVGGTRWLDPAPATRAAMAAMEAPFHASAETDPRGAHSAAGMAVS